MGNIGVLMIDKKVLFPVYLCLMLAISFTQVLGLTASVFVEAQ